MFPRPKLLLLGAPFRVPLVGPLILFSLSGYCANLLDALLVPFAVPSCHPLGLRGVGV